MKTILKYITASLLAFLVLCYLLLWYQPEKTIALNSATSGSKRLPHAIIIGCSKCGTGALKYFLGVHPNITVSYWEPKFFDHDEYYRKGIKGYLERLPKVPAGNILIDKTPSYFADPRVPKRVSGMLPNVKLILTLRNPVSRTISDHTQKTIGSKHSLRRWIQEQFGINLWPPLHWIMHDPFGRINTGYYQVLASLYHVHLKQWLRVFPRSQLLIIDSEELTRDPYRILKEVEKFLELKPVIKPDWLYFSETKGFFCIKKSGCMGDEKGRAHVSVSDATKKELRQFFKPHNAKLFKMLNRTFSW